VLLLLLHGVGLHGAKVVITGRRREVLDEAVADLSASGVTATGLQGDVRSPDACQGWVTSTVQQFGHLNILVNCAAGNFLANAAELSQGGFKTGKNAGCSCLRCCAL
jgi:peroxisomal 2,4-dienoyl-CoA reductase